MRRMKRKNAFQVCTFFPKAESNSNRAKTKHFYPSGELCQPKQEISSKCTLENNQKGVIFATDCHHLFKKALDCIKLYRRLIA